MKGDDILKFDKIKEIENCLLEKQFLESLVLSYKYEKDNRQFLLQTDIPFDPEIKNLRSRGELHMRMFRLMRFSNVDFFERRIGDIKSFGKTMIDFKSSDYGSAHVIQDYKVEIRKRMFQMVFFSDVRMGGCALNFETLEVTTKIGKGKQTDNGDYSYSEYPLGKAFDFSDPFNLH